MSSSTLPLNSFMVLFPHVSLITSWYIHHFPALIKFVTFYFRVTSPFFCFFHFISDSDTFCTLTLIILDLDWVSIRMPLMPKELSRKRGKTKIKKTDGLIEKKDEKEIKGEEKKWYMAFDCMRSGLQHEACSAKDGKKQIVTSVLLIVLWLEQRHRHWLLYWYIDCGVEKDREGNRKSWVEFTYLMFLVISFPFFTSSWTISSHLRLLMFLLWLLLLFPFLNLFPLHMFFLFCLLLLLLLCLMPLLMLQFMLFLIPFFFFFSYHHHRWYPLQLSVCNILVSNHFLFFRCFRLWMR